MAGSNNRRASEDRSCGARLAGYLSWGINMLWSGRSGPTGRIRYHTDDSIQVKYYDHPGAVARQSHVLAYRRRRLRRGGGVSCRRGFGEGRRGSACHMAQAELPGFMVYNRLWFHKDSFD